MSDPQIAECYLCRRHVSAHVFEENDRRDMVPVCPVCIEEAFSSLQKSPSPPPLDTPSSPPPPGILGTFPPLSTKK